MKKILLLIPLFVSTMASAQVRWAPEAGMSLTKYIETVKFSRTTVSNSGSYRPGPDVGIAIYTGLTKRFSIRTGLSYHMTRTKDRLAGTNYIDEVITTIHWLQVPVYFWYRSGLVGEGHFFAGLGPAFNYAISGKEKTKETIFKSVTTKSTSETRRVTFGNNSRKDVMRPFDFGGSITGGYELSSGLYFRAGFTLGLSNLIPEGNDKHTLKSRGFTVLAGYFLNR